MSKIPSTVHKGPIQQTVPACSTIQGVRGEGEKALPEFRSILHSIAEKIGLNPDAFALYNGKKIFLDKKRGIYYKRVTIAPIKATKRCEEKAKHDYNGNSKRILDV